MTIATSTFKPRKSRTSRFWSVALAFVLSACSVTLISHYDEQIDQAATALQKQMDAHLTKLEAASAADATFDANIQFYQDYLVDLRAVELRASTHPKNRQSLGQYTLMLRNLEDLRSTHETEGTAMEGELNVMVRFLLVLEGYNLDWFLAQGLITMQELDDERQRAVATGAKRSGRWWGSGRLGTLLSKFTSDKADGVAA